MAAPASRIALEEHFIIPSFLDYLAHGMPPTAPEVRDIVIGWLSDVGEERLAAMDSAGVRKSVLSISGPGATWVCVAR
jgi:2,3-dihydroxybenzoate decarboxylase